MRLEKMALDSEAGGVFFVLAFRALLGGGKELPSPKLKKPNGDPTLSLYLACRHTCRPNKLPALSSLYDSNPGFRIALSSATAQTTNQCISPLDRTFTETF